MREPWAGEATLLGGCAADQLGVRVAGLPRVGPSTALLVAPPNSHGVRFHVASGLVRIVPTTAAESKSSSDVQQKRRAALAVLQISTSINLNLNLNLAVCNITGGACDIANSEVDICCAIDSARTRQCQRKNQEDRLCGGFRWAGEHACRRRCSPRTVRCRFATS